MSTSSALQTAIDDAPASEPRASSRRRPLSPTLKVVITYSVVQLLIVLPAMVHNPNSYLREELEFLYRADVFGAFSAADPRTASARPLVGLLYSLMYGPLANETAVHWLGPVSSVATAVTLRWFVLRLAPAAPSTAIGLIWLVVPNHLTSTMWLATVNVQVATILSLIALDRVRRPRGRDAVVAGVIAGASLFLYEAALPAVVLGATVLIRLVGPMKLRRALLAGVTFAPFVVTCALMSLGPRTKVFVSPLVSFFYNFGLFHPWFAGAFPIALATIVLLVVVVVRCVLRPRAGQAEWLLRIGFAVWFFGYLPFSLENYDATFIGAGDRMNCISSIGVALVYGGILRVVQAHARRGAYAAAAIFVVVCSLVQGQRSFLWNVATAQTREVAQCVVTGARPSSSILAAQGSGWMRDGIVNVNAATEIDLALKWRLPDGSDTYRLAEAGPSGYFEDAPRFLADRGCTAPLQP